MTELIAKVNNQFKIILSKNEAILSEFDINSKELSPYTASHKPDENEWFYLEEFSASKFMIDCCTENFSSVNLVQIEKKEFNSIKAFGILQPDQKYFQRVTPSYYVQRRTFLDYAGDPTIIEQRNQVKINSEPDAVYIPSKDCLFFRSISKIKSIFPSIGELYRSATEEEVTDFLKHDFLHTEEIENANIGDMNRKRIADIGEKYKNLPRDKKNKLINYAKDKIDVELEEGRFKIVSDSDLKKVLYALDQRYYTADIYGEERVATAFYRK